MSVQTPFKITSNTTAEGWLMKEGHDLMRTWHDRYFVLDSAKKKLSYYSEAQKFNLKGEYEFTANSLVENSNANSSHPNLFLVIGKSAKGDPKSELLMSASSADLKNKWMDAIKKAIKGLPLVETTIQKVGTTVSNVVNEVKRELVVLEEEAEECCANVAACTIA